MKEAKKNKKRKREEREKEYITKVYKENMMRSRYKQFIIFQQFS